MDTSHRSCSPCRNPGCIHIEDRSIFDSIAGSSFFRKHKYDRQRKCRLDKVDTLHSLDRRDQYTRIRCRSIFHWLHTAKLSVCRQLIDCPNSSWLHKLSLLNNMNHSNIVLWGIGRMFFIVLGRILGRSSKIHR